MYSADTSDEARVLEELDEDLVDKLVLRDGLDHQHPLLPQARKHGGDLHGLNTTTTITSGDCDQLQ